MKFSLKWNNLKYSFTYLLFYSLLFGIIGGLIGTVFMALYRMFLGMHPNAGILEFFFLLGLM